MDRLEITNNKNKLGVVLIRLPGIRDPDNHLLAHGHEFTHWLSMDSPCVSSDNEFQQSFNFNFSFTFNLALK